jgi:hypothetical protein
VAIARKRTQFLSGLFDAEMFGDMRLAQPPHRRCMTSGALEPLNRRDADDLCLPVAKPTFLITFIYLEL